MHLPGCSIRRRRWGTRGFSLTELLVVVGVIALMIAIVIPPLKRAHRLAKQTRCGANLQQIGVALNAVQTQTDSDFYPLWDDEKEGVRHTWVDVLLQLGMLTNPQGCYCPEDARPDYFNMARGGWELARYPGNEVTPGIDYSYGINRLLSAGSWVKWRPSGAAYDPDHPRVFEDHLLHTASRVLVADAYWSTIYNLSGGSKTWNLPSWYDNTVAYRRHPRSTANVLKQDGHVDRISYRATLTPPVETQRHFVWYPGEPLHIGPDGPGEPHGGNWYPDRPPVDMQGSSFQGAVPPELIPSYYSRYRLWSRIPHK